MEPIFWEFTRTTNGTVALVAYDLATGDEIWRTLPCIRRDDARNLATAWLAAQVREDAA